MKPYTMKQQILVTVELTYKDMERLQKLIGEEQGSPASEGDVHNTLDEFFSEALDELLKQWESSTSDGIHEIKITGEYV